MINPQGTRILLCVQDIYMPDNRIRCLQCFADGLATIITIQLIPYNSTYRITLSLVLK